jgi:hypothetical protein
MRGMRQLSVPFQVRVELGGSELPPLAVKSRGPGTFQFSAYGFRSDVGLSRLTTGQAIRAPVECAT